MRKPDDQPATLEERLISALISAFAMACTIAALSFIFFVILAKGRYEGAQLFFNFVFSPISLYIISVTAVFGFLLRFETMLDFFSSLWGTRPAHEPCAMPKFAIVIAIILAALFILH
jgi:hypothetical protein